MKLQTSEQAIRGRDIEVILPISRSWESLGTGGGVEAFADLFIRSAVDLGLHTTVLCPGKAGGTKGSVRFVPIMPAADSELAFTRRLRRQIIRGTVQIPRNAVVLADTEHYAWAFRGMRVPIVLMSHGAIPATLRMRHSRFFVRAYRFFIERRAVLRATRIVAVSRTVAEYYRLSYPKISQDKVVEVPIGLELKSLDGRPRGDPFLRLGLPRTTDLILFVGRLYPEKNPMLFVAACDRLRAQGVSFESVVVGDGVLADQLRAATLSRPWLHWIPALEHTEVLDMMTVSRALVICSSYESGPLVLLEAIGVGTPVISTEVGRAPELIGDDTGRIVRADADAIAYAIHEAMAWNPEASRRASAAMRHRIDFRKTMESLVGLLDNAAVH